jgi:L,D-transpeptidase YbiS
VDTLRRFIYIHGTPDEAKLGTPVSHGCIRMSSGAACGDLELMLQT